MGVLRLVLALVRACLFPRAVLAAENLALRQQLIVLKRSVKRPKLRNSDRLFWIVLCRLWKGWETSLHMLQPATVVKWQREGFSGTGDGDHVPRSQVGVRSMSRSVS